MRFFSIPGQDGLRRINVVLVMIVTGLAIFERSLRERDNANAELVYWLMMGSAIVLGVSVIIVGIRERKLRSSTKK